MFVTECLATFLGTNNAGNGNNGGNNPANPTANSNGPTAGNGNNGNNSNSNSSAKIEQLNSMREALFSQDGWGGVSVDTFFFMTI